MRIKRGENYASVSIENLYPIGEGSGYTGGITSSAIDAIKAVERSLAAMGSGGKCGRRPEAKIVYRSWLMVFR